jgi:glycyl-tRNA synthetase beta chain
MSSTKSLLVELFVEELPPKSLKKLGDEFAKALSAGLKARGLATDHSATTAFATPRRLAVHISAVRSEGDPQQLSVKLVPEAIAYDASGTPSPQLVSACVKKAGFPSLAAALELGAFVARDDGGKRYVFHEMLAAGQTLVRALQESLDEALAKLPIQKVMSYQLDDGWSSVNFVRPAHGLVALHGADVVPVHALGLDAGRQTQGHRFEAQMNPVELQDADEYAQRLETQGAVIVSFHERRNAIVRQLQHAAGLLKLTPIHDDDLLDEVTALVERPNVLTCSFESEFLSVPSECLILTMKANQKYFPLLDAEGRLTNKFLVVSNISPADASRIVEGNERVVRPRLADAKFFFDKDRKTKLEDRLPMLDKVVYHAKLGSMGERVQRVQRIAEGIGTLLGKGVGAQAARAALLAKADLVCDMVGEFPELQGIMGAYYARHDGEHADIAQAIEDHYKPRFAGDALPRTDVGICVALADKIETLTGLFSVGERPTGDKDPFALRRHALGVIRMLMEGRLPLSLLKLITLGQLQQRDEADTTQELLMFFRERMGGLLRDQKYANQEIEAVLAVDPGLLAEIPARLQAVRAFAALPEAAPLAAANKRVNNILKKSDAARGETTTLEAALLQEPAEKSLYDALLHVAPKADAHFDKGDYTASLQELAALKAPVDEFFDKVMVNAEDPALRNNRLALLARLHATMNRVADLSKLAN